MDKKFERLLDHDDYELLIGGLLLRVNRDVFAPDLELTYSTGIILDHLPDVKGKDVADIGCGTAVVGIACAKRGAKTVIATDVHEAALMNARQNVEVLDISDVVTVRESNLFEHVPETFDFIFANLPILDEAWGLSDGVTKNILFRFIPEALRHLHPGGALYFPWGSFADIEPVR